MSTETTAIMVTKIRDGDGQPTCRYWDEICPFMSFLGGEKNHPTATLLFIYTLLTPKRN